MNYFLIIIKCYIGNHGNLVLYISDNWKVQSCDTPYI